MAFSKQSSMVTVFAMLMLLATQPVTSRDEFEEFKCKLECVLQCFSEALNHNPPVPLKFLTCGIGCTVNPCLKNGTVVSQPKLQCNLGCVSLKCSGPDVKDENSRRDCVKSCVNDCGY